VAIHYDKKTGRFRDDRGRLVARDKAMRSSIARKEYENATRPKPAAKKPAAKKPAAKAPAKPVKARKAAPAKPVPAKPRKAPAKVSPAKLAPAKPLPVKAKPKPAKPVTPSRPRRAPSPAPAYRPDSRPAPDVELPWEQPEGEFVEFPEDDEWFPMPGDADYDYDGIMDDWGDFDDDEPGYGAEGGDE
jgi:hypothetical protein